METTKSKKDEKTGRFDDIVALQGRQLMIVGVLLALALICYFIFPGFYTKLVAQYREVVEWLSFELFI